MNYYVFGEWMTEINTMSTLPRVIRNKLFRRRYNIIRNKCNGNQMKLYITRYTTMN